MLSNEERIFSIKTFYKGGYSAVTAEWSKHFHTVPPTSKSIEDLVAHFEQTGTIYNDDHPEETGESERVNLSPELAAVVGANCLTRAEVVKKIWDYISERDLFDPENRQYAICDEALMRVIGIERFRTFGIMQFVKHHFI